MLTQMILPRFSFSNLRQNRSWGGETTTAQLMRISAWLGLAKLMLNQLLCPLELSPIPAVFTTDLYSGAPVSCDLTSYIMLWVLSISDVHISSGVFKYYCWRDIIVVAWSIGRGLLGYCWGNNRDENGREKSCSALFVFYFYSAVCENEMGCFSFVFVDPVLTWDRPVFVPFSSRFPSLCDYYMFLIMLIHY
jgi:hypothetical protein